MPKRKNTLRICLSLAILLVVIVAAYNWATSPETASEEPLRYDAQSGPSAVECKQASHVQCIGSSSKAMFAHTML